MDNTTALKIETKVTYSHTPLKEGTFYRETPNEYPTIMQVWAESAQKFGSYPALNKKINGEWKTWTWGEYYRMIRQTAKGFIKLGLEPEKAVAVIGFNSVEWLLSDFGAMFAGGVVAGIYTTNSADQCQYIAEHADAQIACAENTSQLLKFLQVKPQLPLLKALVTFEDHVNCDVKEVLTKAYTDAGVDISTVDLDAKLVYTWSEVQKLGEEVTDDELEARITAQKPTDTCTLIYTSGTTGNPKGVMITHYNIVSLAYGMLPLVDFIGTSDRVVSYLPLSHIAEQVISLYIPLFTGASLWFAEPTALKGGIIDTLKEVRPSIFLGVPRVWEKIQAGILAKSKNSTAFRKYIAATARSIGLRAGYAKQNNQPVPWGTYLCDMLLSKVAQALGLDKCKFAVTGAAPISKDTLEFFLSLGIPIMEVFGMSELTGPATVSLPYRYRTGKCGFPVPGAEIKIAPDGEICIRGGLVCKGYLKNPEATKETIDEQGWLHTGDIGELDKDGFLSITDRKKELLITAGGENIAPALIEGMVRDLPEVSQAVLIGDRRPYLVALVTLDPERMPAECGGDANKAKQDKEFMDYLWKQITTKVNSKLAQVQTIKKIYVLPTDLSIEGGELTPTMKIKRRIVNEKYADIIEQLYAEGQRD